MMSAGLRWFMVLLFVATALTPVPVMGADTAGAGDETLQAANDTFRRQYDRARRELVARVSPLIYCNGEQLVLVTASGKRTENIVPPKYTILKTVDHIALAAYVILVGHVDRQLGQETMAHLEELLKHAAQSRKALASLNLDLSLLQRQYRIIDATVDFAAAVRQSGSVSAARLRQFARGLSGELMENADEAVSAQLARLEEVVTGWKSSMSASDWQGLHVILSAGHMPRERLVTWQYFSELLKERKEGQRVIVMEGIDDLDKGIELLGTHLIDGKIAVDFFGDPWRMHKDLLSSGARRYLQKHHPGR
ncbi:MAG TPA: hypothetical protein V6D08_00570 [Candidatus Obscuribacterales bacterium]